MSACESAIVNLLVRLYTTWQVLISDFGGFRKRESGGGGGGVF